MTEITQTEKWKIDWKKKKINRASGTCGTITKDLTCMSLESQKERRKKLWLESTHICCNDNIIEMESRSVAAGS